MLLYIDLFCFLESLETLKSSMQARQTAEDELQEQLDNMATPEMKAKYKECREAESQLTALEKQLGIVSLLIRYVLCWNLITLLTCI